MFQIFHEVYVLFRLAGLHFFGLFGNAGAKVLIEGLVESDERIVRHAEEKLMRLGEKALPVLLEAVKSKSLLVQGRAAKVLGKLGPLAVHSFSQAMTSEERFVRLEAVSALGMLVQETDAAIPHLIDALNDPSIEIRKISKKALRDIRSRGQTALLEALKSKAKSDQYHALKIAETLAGFGRNVIPDLIEILNTGDKALHRFAIEALRFIGKDALPTAIGLLNHQQSHMRSSAAKICEKMIYKAKDAIPALNDALNDENDDVRFRAAMALGIIGGDPSRYIPVLEELTTPLDKNESYALYDDDHPHDRVQITDENPIVGEVIWDRSGQGFLAPEEDYRGGGMHSIELIGKYFRSGGGKTGDLTRVSGFYEKGVGILVTNMVPEKETSDLVF